jgi:hypothetical protein
MPLKVVKLESGKAGKGLCARDFVALLKIYLAFPSAVYNAALPAHPSQQTSLSLSTRHLIFGYRCTSAEGRVLLI